MVPSDSQPFRVPVQSSTAQTSAVAQSPDAGRGAPHPLATARFSLVLHAHLPYVIHHGTWPHGMEWLHEAAAEVYLPLLEVLSRLERDSIAFHANLVLSPVLLEQLAHPHFKREFPLYLTRKITAAHEDEAFFEQSGEARYTELAHMWRTRFATAEATFQAFGGDLIAGFRHFRDRGMLSLLTSCATHGYLPLLGTDSSVRAQVRLAVATHTRHLGEPPRGIWSPECGFRPAGAWTQPVPNPDGTSPGPQDRIGVDQAFAESGLQFFYLDAPLITGADLVAAPSSTPATAASSASRSAPPRAEGSDRLYSAWELDPGISGLPPVVAFARDPRTAFQVWSTEGGYPAEPAYLDFHKKRWPGGHRYWRVTDSHSDMNAKEIYDPALAAERVASHAAHFAHTLWQTLSPHFGDRPTPILSAPFDAELFGHWWFEGPAWLEAVARTLHNYDVGVAPESSVDYLQHTPPAGTLRVREGSWGAGNNHTVWLNEATAWAWTLIYAAEHTFAEAVQHPLWQTDRLGRRTLQQMARELLLLESSDWHSLITTGAARDYAEARLLAHRDQFNELADLWAVLLQELPPEQAQLDRLQSIEQRDNIFPEIDPSLWSGPTSSGTARP